MKPIDWRSIRTHNGSQYGGFEELCTQLARSKKPKDPKAKFTRLGNPDGGIECYWEDSDGNKYGWQAKYYPAKQDPDKYYLGDIRWGDITKSIEAALKEHPTLTRYYVCVPKNRTLKMDENWKTHVTEWKALAKNKTGRDVEFIWWGDSELTDKLSQSEHAGRRLYWFNEHIFSDEWFRDNWDVARATAGPRYTPELHIDLPIARELEKLNRTNHYINEIRAYTKDIQKGILDLQRLIFYSPSPELKRFTYRFLNSLLTILTQLTALKVEPIGEPTFQDIYKSVQYAITAINEFMGYLSQRTTGYRDPLFDQFKDQITRTLTVLESLSDKVDTEDTQLIIVRGVAGAGKTHLLCDVAKRRVENGLPTVLLMGQRFTSDNEPWVQAREHLDLTRVSMEEFVGVLEAAAQAKGSRALLMIDAVDEGRGSTIWPAHLASFLTRVNISPWITIVLSVRSTDKDAIIPKDIQEGAVSLEHRGFEGREFDAVQAFFPHYGLKLPLTPIFNPEFSNPYFLKVFCQGLTGQGKRILPSELYGISEVFDLYLSAVNEKLARRLDYDPDDNQIHLALMKIAQYFVGGGDMSECERRRKMAKDIVDRFLPVRCGSMKIVQYFVGRNRIGEYRQGLDRKTVKSIVDQLLPGRNYEQSLYRGMVTEGILIEDLIPGTPNTEVVVRFSYERLADHIVADFLLQEYLDKDKPEVAFTKGGGLTFLFDNKRGELEGLIEALSIKVPELTGRELIDLVPSLIEREDAQIAFRESLVQRDLDALSDVTDEVLKTIVASTLKTIASNVVKAIIENIL